MTEDEWDECKKNIKFDYRKDNFFTEFKDSEIISSRVTLLQQLDPYIGRYYSINWARKNILHQSEDEIKELDKEMKTEEKLGLYPTPEEEAAQGQK